METNLKDAIRATLTQMTATPKPRPISSYAEQYRWRFEAYHPALEQVLPAVKQFVSDVIAGDAQPYWLAILGPSGVGKTHILKQAFRMLDRNEHLWEVPTSTGSRFGTRAHVIPSEDLDDWKAARDYGNYDLLYVEDIGSGAGMEKGSGQVTASRVAELLQNRTGRWTMMDANMTRASIAQKLDPRIASRLKRDGSVLIQLPADVPDFSDK